MMTKIKSSSRTATESTHEHIDKKIKDYASEIQQSNSKIDQYINKIDERIALIISGRLDKFIVMHSEIVCEKNNQIKHLQENYEKNKMSGLSENLQKLEKTIRNYEAEFERVASIKEMFRKQSQKLKIQLQIADKELQACKSRQKKLIKRIWILQEDIKDIYSSQANPHGEHKYLQLQSKVKYGREKHASTVFRSKIYHTEPDLQIENMKKHFQQQYLAKFNIKDKAWLKHHITNSLQDQARVTSKTYNSFNFHRVNNQKHFSTSRMKSNKKNIDSMYDDLRSNLRRANRNRQLQPKYVQQVQKSIKKEDFDLICLHGPKIMAQIQKVMIDNYGELKEIDEYSIQLLTMLFKNENAIKILQIVLFNYSVGAIQQIKSNRQTLKNEKEYAEPILMIEDEDISIEKYHPKRQKAQHSIKRRFKHMYTNRKTELFSDKFKP